jgi:heat shock protein HslJ
VRRRGGVGLVLASSLFVLGCQAAGSPTPAAPAPSTVPSSSPLAGTSWRVEEIQGQRAGGEAPSTITFDGPGRVVGSTGCNRYVAPLDIAARALRLGETVMTRRACPPAVMDQEQQFVAALAATRGYRQEGDVLLLLDEGGRPLLRLSRT